MSYPYHNETGWPWVFLMMGIFVLAILLGVNIGKHSQEPIHWALCEQRLHDAKTGSDSLLVINNDKFCLTLTTKEK